MKFGLNVISIEPIPSSYFQFPTVHNASMTAVRTSVMGATLVLLNVGP